MKDKHPLRMVRDAIPMTGDRFASLLGIRPGYLRKIESGAKKFTHELQRKTAIQTGAWIALDEDEKPKPPVFLEWGSRSRTSDGPFAPPQEYQEEHWRIWRGGWEDENGDPILRFGGDNEPLAFWLVVLIAAGEHANKAMAVRAEILSLLEQVKERLALGSAIERILSQYEPTWPEVEMQMKPRKKTERCEPRAHWEPSSHPPGWLRTAMQLEPLAVHVPPPGKGSGPWSSRIRARYKESKEKFLQRLATNPKSAVRWIREDREDRECRRLVLLAEQVASVRDGTMKWGE